MATSDSAGNEIDTYTYSHFGESGPEGDSGFPFRFTGQKIDAETGLYYYKARHYDPETGRFVQTDPIGFGGGMNLYAYVGNDPGNFVDPMGLFGLTTCTTTKTWTETYWQTEDGGTTGVTVSNISYSTECTSYIDGAGGGGGPGGGGPSLSSSGGSSGDGGNSDGNDDDKRGLTKGEKRLIPDCIARNVNLNRVVIKNDRSFGAGDSTVVTRGYRIYWPGAPDDISNSSINDQWLLVHEVTHVWQYKKPGYTVFSFTGRNYSYSLSEHDTLQDFDAEQIASIVADYFLLLNGYNPMYNTDSASSLSDYRKLVGNCMRK